MSAVLIVQAQTTFETESHHLDELVQAIQSPLGGIDGDTHVELFAWTLLHRKIEGKFLTLTFTTTTALELMEPKTWIHMDWIARKPKHLFVNMTTSIYKLQNRLSH